MEINNFIGVYEKELEKKVCQNLIKHFGDLKSMPGVREDSGENKNTRRKDEACFFDEIALKNRGYQNAAEDVQKLNERLQKCFEEYTLNYGISEMGRVSSMVVKIHHVKKHEGYHAFHPEVGGLESSDRCLVWLCYLNDVEEGGETEFLYQGVKVKPEIGKFLIWPAQWTHTHRGNPIYKGEKYYATGWFNFIQ